MLKKEIINEMMKLFGTEERKEYKKELLRFKKITDKAGFISEDSYFGTDGFEAGMKELTELRYRDEYNHDSFGDAYQCYQLMNEKDLNKQPKGDLEGMLQKLQEK